MADQSAAKRARMACRIYLKLYDAGPAGAPIAKADALGPRDDQGGVPHYALTVGMRDRMAEPMGAGQPLADQVRGDLAKSDRGEDVPSGNWLDCEARIRTGQLGAEPL